MLEQIWLDDIHNPSKSHTHLPDPIWVKDGKSFFELVNELINTGEDSNINLISFDNDLGEQLGNSDIDGGMCFNFLERELYAGSFPNLKFIVIHSDNTSRVDMMMGAKDMLFEKFGIRVMRQRRNTNKGESE